MQKIKIRKPVKGYKLGDVYEVQNNVAHRLIDQGLAELYVPEPEPEKEEKGYSNTKAKGYEDRMLTDEEE